MRPLRLSLKGFTAFREEVELDFSQLDVFAISGPTGSGKSSLLDAMTFALYGRVERVGDRVSQLISQGQPRMVVTLEFEVGHERYRVTRSTPTKGATKILLERELLGGGWEQAGDGADRVREVEPMIARAIGLTYDGFTRSVMLPQGRFAELLVGDAKKRREILTELLGLSLFRQMAERASAIAREAVDRAKWTADMLDTEFGDATPAALKDARRSEKDARAREGGLALATDRMTVLQVRWTESQRAGDELRACAVEATEAADRIRIAARGLAELAEALDAATAQAAGHAVTAREADAALGAARSALRDADRDLGTAEALADARIAADRIHRIEADRAGSAAELVGVAQAAQELAAAAERLRAELAPLQARAAVAQEELRDAEAALEAVRHANLVVAVSAGLAIGDPCPVCGVALQATPAAPADGALDRAEAAVSLATGRHDDAVKGVAAAERAIADVERDLSANARDRNRIDGELERLDRTGAVERAALVSLLGTPLPDDPLTEIGRRIAERQRLDQAERAATQAAAAAARLVLEADGELDRIRSDIERQRDRLAVDHRPLVERARRATGGQIRSELPGTPGPGDALVLREHADALSSALGSLAEELLRAADDRAEVGTALLQEAVADLRGLDLDLGVDLAAATLDGVAVATNEAYRSATADVATAAKRVEDLAARLERKAALAEDGRTSAARGALFKALASELDARHIIPFLQAEALGSLAVAGSERLADLSAGRYRLLYDDDEFLVVDTWNGEEARSARTLSGGETFVASLSLALALADQVRTLSTTDRARLDSLFLDEGFGTLDQDTLGTVCDAIERLAGDGRLVGVITHVRELAEQFPRIEVEKSPRGSRVHLSPI